MLLFLLLLFSSSCQYPLVSVFVVVVLVVVAQFLPLLVQRISYVMDLILSLAIFVWPVFCLDLQEPGSQVPLKILSFLYLQILLDERLPNSFSVITYLILSYIIRSD